MASSHDDVITHTHSKKMGFGWRYVDIQIVCLREMITKVSMASGVKLSMPKPLMSGMMWTLYKARLSTHRCQEDQQC